MGLDASIQIHGNPPREIIDEINSRIILAGLSDDTWGSDYNNTFSYPDEDGIAELQTMWRYWGPGYERGPWKDISFILNIAGGMNLDVRYGSDSDEHSDEGLSRFTAQRYIEFWRHYCGPRWNDYRKSFDVAQQIINTSRYGK